MDLARAREAIDRAAIAQVEAKADALSKQLIEQKRWAEEELLACKRLLEGLRIDDRISNVETQLQRQSEFVNVCYNKVPEMEAQLQRQAAYLDLFQRARPEEEQTLMALFSRLDLQAKLHEQQQQQAHESITLQLSTMSIGLAQHQGRVGELAKELNFTSMATTKNQGQLNDLARDFRQLQAAAASTWPPGVPQPSVESRPRRRFGNFAREGCDEDGCNRDHGKGSGSAPHEAQLGAYASGPACHCEHVDRLIADAITDERLFQAARADIDRLLARDAAPMREPPSAGEGHFDPWHRPEASPGASAPAGRNESAPGVLPLALGSLGALGSNRVFDDRVSVQDDFRLDGRKNGHQWKSKTERYFISKVPALSQLLRWAEREETAITPARLREAAGRGLCTVDRDGPHDHTDALNSAVWGFLSNCIAGEAEVMFKQAEQCNGIDAWRRVVRFIDNGRAIHLEQLRNEIRTIRAFPIKNLEGVTVGVAAFENKVREFVEAGGRQPTEEEMKSDLNALLPPELGDHLTLRVTDPHQAYASFREFAVLSCAQLLMRRKRLPIHNVDEKPTDAPNEEEETGGYTDDDPRREEILAALRQHDAKYGRRKGGGKGPRAKGGGKGGGGGGGLGAGQRKCQNCGGMHNMADCRKPVVDKTDRPCWVCDKKGHLGANCPMKNQRSPLKNVEEIPPMINYNVNEGPETDVFGFQVVGRRSPGVHGAIGVRADEPAGETPSARALGVSAGGLVSAGRRTPLPRVSPTKTGKSKPRATQVTLGMHLQNAFGPLTCAEEESREIAEVERIMIVEELEEINAVRERTTIRVAMDSGAVKHVTHPSTLPSGVKIIPNTTGKHFSGAGGEVIERYGSAQALLTTAEGREIVIDTNVAEVSRPLHAVSQVTGPADHPTGKQDVLFTNKRCVVVQPGVVEHILKYIKPIAQYDRDGNLYLATMTVSDFVRPGPGQ